MDSTFIITNLKLMSEKSPEYSGILENCIEDIAEKAHQPNGDNITKIFHAIDQGHFIDRQIASFTNIPLAETRRLLDLMVREGSVKIIPQGGKGESARGAAKQLHTRS